MTAPREDLPTGTVTFLFSKTSVPTELAWESAAQFAGGGWFVALDFVADQELVGSAIVAGLDLRGPSEKPVRDRLVENLSERRALEQFIAIVDVDPLEVARTALDPATFQRAIERGRDLKHADVGACVHDVSQAGAEAGAGGPPSQARG